MSLSGSAGDPWAGAEAGDPRAASALPAAPLQRAQLPEVAGALVDKGIRVKPAVLNRLLHDDPVRHQQQPGEKIRRQTGPLGLIPENELAQSLGVTLDPRTKGPVCNGQLMTSVDGIFSCGNALHVEGQPGSFRVSGNACKRGEAFAISEQTAPMRTLCTTVRTGFAAVPVLPVRLSGEIPKEKIFDAMAAINAITLARHIAIGGVIEPDLAGLGVDLIAASGLLRPADG